MGMHALLEGEKRDGRAVILACGLVLALAGWPAAAQQLNVQTYTTADGLPQQQIFSLHQDATGYLWLGSYGGASRYDGQSFRTFNLASGLRSNVVLDFAEDTAERLWVGTEGGGLCRFDGERFHCAGKEAGLPSDDVRKLAPDGWGGLWAATPGGLLHRRDGYLRTYTRADGLPSTDCWTVTEDARGGVWVGTAAGLARLAGSRFEAVNPEELGPRQVTALLPTKLGLVVGTDAGAYLLRDGGLRRLDLPSPLAAAAITAAAREGDDGFWLTTRKGAVRYQEGRLRVVSAVNGLSTEMLLSVLVDREENVWIGTADGVNKIVPGPFLGYTERHGLPQRYVSGLTGDGRGRLWLAMPYGGIAIQDGETRRLIGRNEGLTDPGAYALAVLPDDSILAATASGLALVAGERVVRTYPKPAGLGVITCLLADRGGAWVGAEGGLARWQEGRIAPTAEPALRGLSVLALARDRDGRLWIGLKSGGVVVYDGHGIQRLNAATGLTDQAIWDLALHPDGAMWVASHGQGVFRVQNGRVRRYTTRDGLVDNTVWQVLCARHGDVWLYTSRGLDRFDGHRFRHYDHSDGLIALEGSSGAAAWEDAAGEIWFGTGKGLVRYLPQEERTNAVPPRTVIEEAESAHRRRLPVAAHLSPGAGSVTFRFAALSYRDAGAIRFRYRLAGLDDRWTGATAERSVSFASLPPGAYVFEVAGSNDDGVFAAVPARFAFVVDPFFWQTWWFRITLAAAAGAALLSIHWWRTRKLQADRHRLELAVTERTVELEKMNRRLQDLATTDELTGLANRRQFRHTLEAHLCTLSRTRSAQGLSLLLIDIDRFKQVNDLYGHPAGDALLVALTHRLRGQVRTCDLVARYGGEEFAVVLPSTDRSGAAALAWKINRAIREQSFEIAGRPLRVTVSVGVTTLKATGTNVAGLAERLLREADEALYRAKGEGRDRVVAAGPALVPTPALSAS